MSKKSPKLVSVNKYASDANYIEKAFVKGEDDRDPKVQHAHQLKELILNSTKNWFKNSTFHGKPSVIHILKTSKPFPLNMVVLTY